MAEMLCWRKTLAVAEANTSRCRDRAASSGGRMSRPGGGPLGRQRNASGRRVNLSSCSSQTLEAGMPNVAA